MQTKVDPNALGGGYSDFRIVIFNYGTDTAADIYPELKAATDAGKHIMLHIHDTTISPTKDYGIHAVQTTGDNSFEFEDVRYMFDSQKMIIHRWIITPEDITHAAHVYLLKTLEA